jgi:hypothetical protein
VRCMHGGLLSLFLHIAYHTATMEGIVMEQTNSALATEHKTTARQISKSRKRGYILRNDGVKVVFTAPAPAFITTNPTGHKKGR